MKNWQIRVLFGLILAIILPVIATSLTGYVPGYDALLWLCLGAAELLILGAVITAAVR